MPGPFVLLGFLFVALRSPTHALQVLEPGKAALGQQLGESIVRIDQTLAAAAGHERGDDVAFMSALGKTLTSDQQVLVNPRVNQVIAEANSLADVQALQLDTTCPRSWDQPCPDGWDHMGASICSAPQSYAGGCKALQDFAAASESAKAKFASACKAPWPCEGTCPEGHDYESCPTGWQSLGGGFCKRSTPSGSDNCAGLYNFADMSVGDKQELAASGCGIGWKCKLACDQDYSSTCPEGWTETSGVCVAPATYVGDCSYSVNTAQMSTAQKRAHASKCALRYPCRGAESKHVSSGASSAEETPNGPVESGSGRIVAGGKTR